MQKTAKELITEARGYLVNARRYINDRPIEELLKVLVFSFYVYYKISGKLSQNQRKEFKLLFDNALKVVNINKRVKSVFPKALVYEFGIELKIINVIKAILVILEKQDFKENDLKEQEKQQKKEEKLNRALGMIQKSRFDGALSQFKQLSSEFPNDYKMHKEISWKLFEVKHIECITFLEKTVGLNPKDAESYAALGQVYRQVKKYKEAISANEKAVALDKENKTYLFNLARAYMDNRSWNEAKQVLLKLIEIDPNLVPAQRALEFVSRPFRADYW